MEKRLRFFFFFSQKRFSSIDVAIDVLDIIKENVRKFLLSSQHTLFIQIINKITLDRRDDDNNHYS